MTQSHQPNHALALIALLTLLATPVLACKQLVQFPEHLAGTTSNWPDAYRVVEIVEAHEDRIVGRTTSKFGVRIGDAEKITFYFQPNEQAHAICVTPFEVGETYLVFSVAKGNRREISRFNWLNVPKDHVKFKTYVEDIQRARAAYNSLERTRER